MFHAKMSITILSILSILGAVSIAPTAAATVAVDQAPTPFNIIDSSPLWADSGQTYHACNVVNVTAGNVSLKVEILDATGNVIGTSGATLVTLPPGTVQETAATGYTGFAHCRVTVNGTPSNIRANLTVFHWTGTYYDSLATAEVR